MSSLMRSCAHPGRLLAAFAVLAAAACSEPNPGPSPDEDASLQVTVVTRDVLLDRITAEVTGPGISPALLFNLTLENGVARATLRVPPGADRTITLLAYEDTGDISYEGSATIDVRPGLNNTVSIVLRSRAGQLPITGTIGSIAVEVLGPGAIEVAGASAQYTARVYNVVNGTEITLAPGAIEWAVSKPALAEVSAAGLVTSLGGSGEVLVVANYDGVAGVASVQVGPRGVLRGTVTTPPTLFVPAQPVVGATLTFQLETGFLDAPTYTLVTQANGSFSASLPVGVYRLAGSTVPIIVPFLACSPPSIAGFLVPDSPDFILDIVLNCS